MKFIWDAKYSVNIKSIDDQHKKFFETINSIYYFIRTRQVDKDQVIAILKELNDYAANHLSYEEKIFDQIEYPDKEDHLRHHNTFREYIHRHFQEIHQDNVDFLKIANDMADFSQVWLSEHIMSTDQKYSQFFLAHDIK